MYVAPEARGASVGRTLLEALERWAVELGFDTLRLETGDRLLDAIRLYEGAGYRRGPCWGPYLTDPKRLLSETDAEMIDRYLSRPGRRDRFELTAAWWLRLRTSPPASVAPIRPVLTLPALRDRSRPV